jgi:hypothetical protein
MAFDMYGMLAESALLIGATVLSNDSISHRRFASIAPGPVYFEVSGACRGGVLYDAGNDNGGV